MKKIYLSEHSFVNTELNLGGISYKVVLGPSMKEIATTTDNLLAATHAILHHNADEFKKLKDKIFTAQNFSEKTLIILRVSEGDKSKLETAQHDKWICGENGFVAYVLLARNQKKVLEDNPEIAINTLRAFFAMTPAQAEAVYSGRLDECHPVLRPLFDAPRHFPNFFYALSILCQGYLTIGALANDERSSVNKEQSSVVKKALERTGWTTLYSQDSESVIKNLDLSTRVRREELWQYVIQTDSDYWKPLSGEKKFMENFVKEWKSFNNKELTNSVNWLVIAIDGKKSIDQPDSVAQAYLDIVDVMEAKL